MENLVGLPIGFDHQAGPQLQRIGGGVACGGLVEPGDVGEIAQVADLEKAVEAEIVLPFPPHRQTEGGQDAAVEVAEDQVAGNAHGGASPTIIRVARLPGGSPTGADPSGCSDTTRMS